MSRRESLDQLRHASPVILPSLLLCDFGSLEREVARLTEAGIQALHLDVMDGHFVPNLTYGMPIVAALRKLTSMPLDVHLMIAEPARYLQQFVDAGADVVTVHVEAVREPAAILETLHTLGVGAGLALNPATPLSTLNGCRELLDVLLIMSVQAGFGGQSFQPAALDKLREARRWAGPDVLLEIDGGVNGRTIAGAAAAGAQMFVIGSAIFGAPDYTTAVRDLRALALT